MKTKFVKQISLILFFSFIALRGSYGQDITHFKENKTSFHGNLSATTIFYHTNGLTQRKPSFAYILGGNFTLNLKGFIFPFSFTYSDQNKSFRQPFNHYGVSPQWKWIKVHLGYRNINFSKYVLGGHTVLGAGLELTPGLFRFGIVYGRLQRKTNQATSIYNPISDTITSFTRKMISFKVGVGNRNNYFDFIVLRATDDSTSIDPSVKETGNFPATNFVTGINTHFTFTPTLHFEAEAAYSIYTANQNSVIAFDVPDFVNKVIPINLSSKGLLAVSALFEYKNKKGLKFGLKYRRIDPGYQSMGSYFINNDLENITFNTGFAAFKRKLRFNGSIGLERNNLKTARNATTKKVIGSAMFSYDPIRQFGITLNYSNYSINQQAGRIQIADSVKLYQTNGTFMVMPHVQLMSNDNKLSQFISIIFTRMKLNDKNIYTGSLNSFTTINNMINYTITFIPIGLSATAAVNYNKVNMSIGNSTNTGGSIGINKSFLKNKITTGFIANITQSKNAQQTYLVFNTGINGRMRLGKHHSFRIKVSLISTKDKTNSIQNSNEQIGDFSYVFTF